MRRGSLLVGAAAALLFGLTACGGSDTGGSGGSGSSGDTTTTDATTSNTSTSSGNPSMLGELCTVTSDCNDASLACVDYTNQNVSKCELLCEHTFECVDANLLGYECCTLTEGGSACAPPGEQDPSICD